MNRVNCTWRDSAASEKVRPWSSLLRNHPRGRNLSGLLGLTEHHVWAVREDQRVPRNGDPRGTGELLHFSAHVEPLEFRPIV